MQQPGVLGLACFLAVWEKNLPSFRLGAFFVPSPTRNIRGLMCGTCSSVFHTWTCYLCILFSWRMEMIGDGAMLFEWSPSIKKLRQSRKLFLSFPVLILAMLMHACQAKTCREQVPCHVPVCWMTPSVKWHKDCGKRRTDLIPNAKIGQESWRTGVNIRVHFLATCFSQRPTTKFAEPILEL